MLYLCKTNNTRRLDRLQNKSRVMTLLEAIEARHSVRAYKNQPLTEDIVKALEDKIAELNKEGQTILIVTHDVALSKKVKRVVAIRDGKISSERVLKESYADRLKEVNIDWRNEDTQEEYVVMDKAGRVQIPKDVLEKLNLSGNKLKLEMQDGKILITAPESAKGVSED